MVLMICFTATPIASFIKLSTTMWTSGFLKTKEDEFDLSEMTGKFKSEKIKNVSGKFKSEVGSTIITEFIELSPKSYSYKYCDKEIKKAKGVPLAVSDKTMETADYKRVLDSNQSQTRTIYGIRSFNQQLYTTCEDKVVLTSFYDKMKMIDSNNCEPFGFIDLKNKHLITLLKNGTN